jgi:Arm domain-containing DNA-binding protein
MPAIKRKTLTKASVEAAAAKSTAYRIWDAKAPGLALRILPSGLKTFEMHLGRGTSEKLGRYPVMTLEAARTQAQAATSHYAVHRESRRSRHSKAKGATFRSFLDDTYGPWVEAERKSGKATVAKPQGAIRRAPRQAADVDLGLRHRALQGRSAARSRLAFASSATNQPATSGITIWVGRSCNPRRGSVYFESPTAIATSSSLGSLPSRAIPTRRLSRPLSKPFARI